MEVVDLFSHKDTVDELGIAGIRDALSDLLGPGTSTIQTQTRYFLFVPWMYRILESKRSVEGLKRRARKFETDLIEALVASGESLGVIGIDARERVRRLPSDIYWAGLGTLGIRFFRGSQDRYQRVVERGRERGDASLGLDEDHAMAWHPHVPEPPADFPERATFDLRREEGEYLLDRLRQHARRSLLLHLCDSDDPWVDAELPWEHPAVRRASGPLAELIEHARCFSEIHHGAALLYNLLLAEARSAPELIERYRDALAGWAGEIEQRRSTLEAWDRGDFWSTILGQNPRITLGARSFTDSWIDLVLGVDAARLSTSEAARDLVARREMALKRDRSRLRSRAHLAEWGGAAGTTRLDYRWGMVSRVAAQILAALEA